MDALDGLADDERRAEVAEARRRIFAKPTVSEVLELARAYYSIPGNLTGGSLHIVLDDGGTEDIHVAFCVTWAVDDQDEPGFRLARVLQDLTERERDLVSEGLYGPGSLMVNDSGVGFRPVAADTSLWHAAFAAFQRKRGFPELEVMPPPEPPPEWMVELPIDP